MALSVPCDPHLHGVLEADLARQQVGAQCGLRHHQLNKIVSEQVDPYLLDRHGGRLATQAFHPQGRLDVAQVQFHVPSALVEGCYSSFVGLLRTQERCHERLVPGAQLSHRHALRRLVVVRLRHPARLDDGFVYHEQMVARTQPPPQTKIGRALARAVLLEYRVDTPSAQFAQQEIRRIERIAQQQIAPLQRIEHRAQ